MLVKNLLVAIALSLMSSFAFAQDKATPELLSGISQSSVELLDHNAKSKIRGQMYNNQRTAQRVCSRRTSGTCVVIQRRDLWQVIHYFFNANGKLRIFQRNY
ncbi:MAG: hypothetical protein KTR35_15775 [Gammaproteobacteria bacterium]|nr:hypothetical protein [Gammaproteobacteria bacterium]